MIMKQCCNDYDWGKFKLLERNLTKCDTVHYKSHITGFGSKSTLRDRGIHRIFTGAGVRVCDGFKLLRVSSDVEHL